MAVHTPRGMRIHLPVPYAFSLMARLSSGKRCVDAYQVLRLTEGIFAVPSMVGYTAGLCCAVGRTSLPVALSALLIGRIVGELLGRYGVALLPLLTAAGRAWSVISHYGLLFALAVSVFWLRYGWLGALLWMAVSLAGLGIGVAAMAIEKVRWYMALGVDRGLSERAFIAAYLIYADKLGASIDCRVPEEEIASGSWRACLAGYLTKCPQVVRFGGEEQQSLAEAEGVGVPGESGDDVRNNHGGPGGAEESEEVVPDWPYAGPRRAWWPPGALSKSWAVVALPPQVTGQITVAEYRELVIDHLIWVAKRDGWTADSLCRYAERMIPDLLYTGELLNCRDLRDAVGRLVTGNRGYEAMCTNGIYSKPMHIEPLPTGAEDAALESSIEGWLDELVPVYRD